MDAWASKSSIQLIQSYCHTKLVALSEGRHSRTYGLWMLLKWGRLRSSLGCVKTRPPSPLRIPAWIPRHRRNIFLLLVTMTHKSDSGDKLRTIQQERFLPLKSNKSYLTPPTSILRCALQEHDWKSNKNASGRGSTTKIFSSYDIQCYQFEAL